jgi:hypothetical protein
MVPAAFLQRKRLPAARWGGMPARDNLQTFGILCLFSLRPLAFMASSRIRSAASCGCGIVQLLLQTMRFLRRIASSPPARAPRRNLVAARRYQRAIGAGGMTAGGRRRHSLAAPFARRR